MIRTASKRFWRGDPGFYKLMYSRHRDCWRAIQSIIQLTGWEDPNIFEVGGGSGFVSEWTRGKYTCVELNPGIVQYGKRKFPSAEFINDNFLKMDVRPLAESCSYDLFLSASVIEHCPGYQALILKALDLKPKLAIITFFRCVLWDADVYKRIDAQDISFWLNAYSAEVMTKWLKSLPIRFEFFTVLRDEAMDLRNSFLLIDPTGGLGKDFWKKVEAIPNLHRGWMKEKKEEWVASRRPKKKK